MLRFSSPSVPERELDEIRRIILENHVCTIEAWRPRMEGRADIEQSRNRSSTYNWRVHLIRR